MQQPRLTSDMSVTVARLPDPRMERPADRPHSSSFSSTASASHHTSPSPVSGSNRSSSNSSSHSPMTLPPPQSPLQMSKTLLSNSGGIAGGKPSPLLAPQADRRPSLISLGPSSLGPSSPSMPASPAGSRFSVPTVRDLRSSAFLNAICGMNVGLTHAVRAAVQGHAVVDAEGKVQIVPATPPVSTAPSTASPPMATAAAAAAPVKQPASTMAPVSGSLRRRNSTSENSVSSTHSSTPSTPRRDLPPAGAGAGAAGSSHPLSASDPHSSHPHGELQISRHVAFHQLLLNLLTYLPPLPSALLAGGPNGELKRVFVGLSVGTSAGKPFYEEKMVWPVSSLPTAAAASSSSGGSSHAAAAAAASASHLPTSPVGSAGHSKTPSTGSAAATVPAGVAAAGAGAGELLHSAGSSTPPLSSRTPLSLSRRPSMGSDEAGGIGSGWNDGDIVLSVFLLLDPIDIDSKQITFVAHSRSIDTNALFQLLYKRDFSAPNTQRDDRPLTLYAQLHAQMTLPPPLISATSNTNSPTATSSRSAVQQQQLQQSQQHSAGVSKSLAALAFAPTVALAATTTSPTKPAAAQ